MNSLVRKQTKHLKQENNKLTQPIQQYCDQYDDHSPLDFSLGGGAFLAFGGLRERFRPLSRGLQKKRTFLEPFQPGSQLSHLTAHRDPVYLGANGCASWTDPSIFWGNANDAGPATTSDRARSVYRASGVAIGSDLVMAYGASGPGPSVLPACGGVADLPHPSTASPGTFSRSTSSAPRMRPCRRSSPPLL